VVEPNWLTTAQAGRRLGVDPTVVIKWVKVGRLRGRRDEDRWRIDPASVEEELKRISRASWWRRVDMPKGRAEGLQQAATKRLVTAATLWRRDPDNPELTAALIAAIDEPMAHSMRTTRVVDSRGSSSGPAPSPASEPASSSGGWSIVIDAADSPSSGHAGWHGRPPDSGWWMPLLSRGMKLGKLGAWGIGSSFGAYGSAWGCSSSSYR